MAEIMNVLVWAGFIYILFIFLRGMNETQVKKHQEKLDEIEKKNLEKQTKNNKEEEKI